MSQKTWYPWLERACFGAAGVGLGLALVILPHGAAIGWTRQIAFLFTLAVVTGFAKTGTP